MREGQSSSASGDGLGSSAPSVLRYRRVLLKLSGEALMGEQPYGIDHQLLTRVVAHLRDVHELGIELAIVVGGGNIYRGIDGTRTGIDRVTGDYMGMLATIMNALALRSALEQGGLETRVQTAIRMDEVAEPFIRLRAIRHLELRRVVVFAAGTGHPFFTTDTTAALRAAEIQANVLLMAKNKVDGIYRRDPRHDPTAARFDTIDYDRLLQLDLKVMDPAAVTLSRDVGLPIIVFNFDTMENLKRAVLGEPVGTLVRRDPP